MTHDPAKDWQTVVKMLTGRGYGLSLPMSRWKAACEYASTKAK